MYAFIRGKIAARHEDHVVIEAAGIGYEIFTATRTLERLGATGEDALIYTYMNVKEDGVTLYGFLSESEKAMFKKIIGVSGIGPKTAISVLSVMSEADLAIALVSEDVNSISRVPGIGKKTAQRMILELKEKVDNDELKHAVLPQSSGANPSMAHDAVQALMALGFSSAEAGKAVREAGEGFGSVEELITAALKNRSSI